MKLYVVEAFDQDSNEMVIIAAAQNLEELDDVIYRFNSIRSDRDKIDDFSASRIDNLTITLEAGVIGWDYK